jgi:transcription elongation factor SPT4
MVVARTCCICWNEPEDEDGDETTDLHGRSLASTNRFSLSAWREHDEQYFAHELTVMRLRRRPAQRPTTTPRSQPFECCLHYPKTSPSPPRFLPPALSLLPNMSYEHDDVDDREEEEEDGIAPQIQELAQASVPTNLRSIRACKRCGLLKTLEQFYEDGCENCPFLTMGDDADKVSRCTTAFFEGQAAIMDPRDSWSAKWIRVDAHLPGVYALQVTGQFDRDLEEDMESRGIRWRCRPSHN